MGSFVHVIKRGTRGLPIVRDKADRDRFLLMLAHFNDEYQPANWFRDISSIPLFARPPEWPDQKKLVRILSFCLLTNHFHLLLEETTEGGISKFMQRLGTGMSGHFNERYKERGSMFQGSYRSKTVSDDRYLRYVVAYIQIKNTFEMYPGARKRRPSFDELYSWASHYPYSSLGDYLGLEERSIIDVSALSEMFPVKEFKSFSRDFLLGRAKFSEDESATFCFE